MKARFVTALEDCMTPVDAVINLAGAGLADRRWSAAYKEEIVSSRVDLTRAVGWMARCSGAAAKPGDQRQRDWLLRGWTTKRFLRSDVCE